MVWGETLPYLDCLRGVSLQVRESDSLGWPLSRLLPALQLPEGEVGARLRQHTVGELGGEGANCFPVSCLATREEGGVSLLLWVYSALSGLLLLDQEGRVTQGDPAFCSLVLGHGPTGREKCPRQGPKRQQHL